MSGRLEGKVAVITGAGSGIGQAIAIRFAGEGASVVIDYVGAPEGANDTKARAEAAGGKAITIQADVTKTAETKSLIDQTWQQFGRCDILVNNAGIEKGADFWDVTEAAYDAVLDVNLRGAFFLTQAFVRRLRDAKKARPNHQYELRPRGHGLPAFLHVLRVEGCDAHVDAQPLG